MISKMLTAFTVAISLFLTGCSTTQSTSTFTKDWAHCATAGGIIWGVPGAVHSVATGGITLAAGAVVSGVTCALDDGVEDSGVLPARDLEGTTVARFKIDSSVLTKNNKAVLDSFLEGKLDASFTVIGHTCNKGFADYNQKLSVSRANSVKSYLLEKGVRADQIRIIGKGQTKSLYPNTSEENRRKNRRVEIVFEHE